MKMLFIRQRGWILLLVIWTLVTIFCLECYASIYVYDLQTNEIEFETHVVFSYEFGSQWPPEGHVGMTVVADPEDGCTSVKPPPNATGINQLGKWFVLMKIGGCDVTIKARNAQNATYDFIIFHRDDDWISYSQHMVFDNTTSKDIKINAVLTLTSYADDIRQKFLYGKNVFFHITPGNDYCFQPRWYKKGMVINSTACDEWMKDRYSGGNIGELKTNETQQLQSKTPE